MSIEVLKEVFRAQFPDQEYRMSLTSRGRSRGRTEGRVVRVKASAMKAVLISLGNHAHDDWTNAYPSIKTIREETLLRSNTTICAALGALEKLGAIIQTGTKPGGTKIYTIIESVILELQPLESAITQKKSAITLSVNEPLLEPSITINEPIEPARSLARYTPRTKPKNKEVDVRDMAKRFPGIILGVS
jgi:hypothetical protein